MILNNVALEFPRENPYHPAAEFLWAAHNVRSTSIILNTRQAKTYNFGPPKIMPVIFPDQRVND